VDESVRCGTQLGDSGVQVVCSSHDILDSGDAQQGDYSPGSAGAKYQKAGIPVTSPGA
jgi:hypothetical protein